MVKVFLDKVKQSNFFRSVFVLAAGTGAAQMLTIAATPVLTRLYSPSDFGALALFTGIVSVISVIATARYELAIMLPKKDEDAASLTVLSMTIVAVVSLVVLAVIVVGGDEISRFFTSAKLGGILYFLPVTIFFAGLFQALNWWSNRKKQVKRLAVSGVSQAGGSVLSQFFLGLTAKAGAGGLIAGVVFGNIIAAGFLFNSSWKDDQETFKKVTKEDLKRNALAYSRFPKYSMLGALANGAASQMPIFILNRFFTAQITGVFSLTFRVLSLPMSFLTAAISQVLFQRIVSIQHEDPKKVRPYVLKTALMLSLLMVPFVFGAWLFGEPVFVFVFGEAWRQAGHFAALLAIAVAIRFVVSPLGTVLVLEHNLRLGVIWQVLYFISITLVLYFSKDLEISLFLRIFVLHELVLYGLYFIFILLGTEGIEKEKLGKTC